MNSDHYLYDWNTAEDTTPFPRVEIDDETLRDGLQSPSVRMPDLETRRQCVRLMAKLGIQRADLGLPMSSQLPAIEGLLETVATESLPIRPGLAVRTAQVDLETVARLRDKFPTLNIKACAFLGTSRIRMLAEGWTWEKVRETGVEATRWATAHGIPVMFVTEDTTRSHPEDVRDIYVSAVQAGAGEVCLSDTCGHAMPAGAAALVRFVRGALADAGLPRVDINWHGHSDRGLGVVNALAAVRAGADVIHGTILGIGERCGNASVDQLLVNLKLMGAWDAPLSALSEYVDLVSRATETPVPVGYPAFGRDAFRTGTGVHAAAIVKARRMGDEVLADLVYSAVPASLVGRRQSIEIGPLSGRWCVKAWLDDHQMADVGDALIDRILTVARERNAVLDDDTVRGLLAAG